MISNKETEIAAKTAIHTFSAQHGNLYTDINGQHHGWQIKATDCSDLPPTQKNTPHRPTDSTKKNSHRLGGFLVKFISRW